MEAGHHVACELPKLNIHIVPFSSKQKWNKPVDEDEDEEAEARVHFASQGIIAFGGSLLETFACEWEIL